MPSFMSVCRLNLVLSSISFRLQAISEQLANRLLRTSPNTIFPAVNNLFKSLSLDNLSWH